MGLFYISPVDDRGGLIDVIPQFNGVPSNNPFVELQPYLRISRIQLSSKAELSVALPPETSGQTYKQDDDTDYRAFIYIPNQNRALLQVPRYRMTKLVELTDGKTKAQWGNTNAAGNGNRNSKTAFAPWTMGAHNQVQSGPDVFDLVMVCNDKAGRLDRGILCVAGNRIDYVNGEDVYLAQTPRSVTAGARLPDGSCEFLITFDDYVTAYNVKAPGTGPDANSGLPFSAEVTSYFPTTAQTGETLYNTFYDPNDGSYIFVTLVDTGTPREGGAYKLDGETGDLIWQTDLFILPDDLGSKARTMEATANLEDANKLVLRQQSVGNGAYVAIDLVTGGIIEGIFDGSIFDADTVTIWDGGTDTLYGDNANYATLDVPDDTQISLATLVSDIAERAGFDPSEVIATRLEGKELIGYTHVGSLADLGNDLSNIYDITWTERGGEVVYTYQYENDALIVDGVAEQDRLALLSESDNSSAVSIFRQSDERYPRVITFEYMNIDDNYNADMQEVPRSNSPYKTNTATEKVKLSSPIVLRGNEAKSLIQQAMASMWAKRLGFTTRLPAEFIKYDPGDVLRFTADNVTYSGIISRNTINDDNTVTTTLLQTALDTYPIERETQENLGPTRPIEGLPVRAVIIDGPALSPAHTNRGSLGAYAALSGINDDGWIAGRLDMAPGTNPTNFSPRYSTDRETPIGALTGAMQRITTPFETDYLNALYVSIGNIPIDAFEAATYEEMLNGANLLVLVYQGVVEYVQFGGVEVIDSSNVKLTMLFRGRYGTDNNVNRIQPGAYVLFPDDIGNFRYNLDIYRNQEQFVYRAMSPQQPEWQAEQKVWVPQANSRKPHAPNHLQATRLVTGDIALEWKRRVRFGGPLEDGTGEVYLDEPSEVYNASIIDPDTLTSIRQLGQINGAPMATYYIGDQTDDGTNDAIELGLQVAQVNVTHTGQGFFKTERIGVREVDYNFRGRVGADVKPSAEIVI